MRGERRALILLAAAAVLLAALMGATGSVDVVLYSGPALLIAGALLSGHHVVEERILARRLATAPRLRATRQSSARLSERALTSLLERSPSLLRGPPAPSAA